MDPLLRELDHHQPIRGSSPSASHGSQNPSSSPPQRRSGGSRAPKKSPYETDREAFLERNRISAAKGRRRKREVELNMEEAMRTARGHHVFLAGEVIRLKEEIITLKSMCLQHVGCRCTRIRRYMTAVFNHGLVDSAHFSPSICRSDPPPSTSPTPTSFSNSVAGCSTCHSNEISLPASPHEPVAFKIPSERFTDVNTHFGQTVTSPQLHHTSKACGLTEQCHLQHPSNQPSGFAWLGSNTNHLGRSGLPADAGSGPPMSSEQWVSSENFTPGQAGEVLWVH